MNSKGTGQLDYSFHVAKSGVIEILRRRRVVSTLRDAVARDFLAAMHDASLEAQQQLMARVSGNYKRGNERLAAGHPRNRRVPDA